MDHLYRIRYVVVAALMMLPIAATGKPQFALPASANGDSYGNNDGEIVTADMNGDGKIDVVTGSNTLLLGDGDGTFRLPKGIGGIFGDTSQYVAVGDVTGDGIPDVVVSEVGFENEIAVFPGKGNGTFSSPIQYPLADIPRQLTLVDLNGDKKLDIVVATTNNTIDVILGNGDGTFQPVSAYAVPGVTGFAVGNVNHDDIPDIIAQSAGGISVLLGNGDGTFKPALTSNNCGGSALALGDINGDGNLDIVSSFGYACLGNGDGTFQTQYQIFNGGSNWQSLTLGDVVGNGRLDIVAVDTQYNVDVLLNDGTGNFGTPEIYPIGGGGTTPAVPTPVLADANGDGHLDILVPIPDNNTVVAMINNGDGTFAVPTQLPGTRTTSVLALDMNGDNKMDLVTANGDDTIGVQLGNGDGSFAPEVTYDNGFAPLQLLAADLNHDGHPDIVAVSNGEIQTWINNSDGTLRYGGSLSVTPGSTVMLGIADVNGDGYPDLVIATNTNPASVAICTGRGDGTFNACTTPQNAPQLSGFVYGGAVGDVNGDGKPDILVNMSTTIAEMLGDGKGGIASSSTVELAPNSCSTLLLADMNGDGKPDVVCGTGIMYGNGDGTFQPMKFVTSVGQQSGSPIGGALAGATVGELIADVNGDGRPDIIICGGYSAITIFLQGPDGYFHAPSSYEMGTQLSACAVADVNSDGRADLIGATTRFTDAVSVSLQLASEHPPTVENLTLHVSPNTAVQGQLVGTDSDDDALSYVVVTAPQQGTVSAISSTGAFTYVADSGESDQFTVVADDGVEYSNVATVTIEGTSSSGPPPQSGSGGGGALEWCALLGLALAAAYRRFRRAHESRE